MAGAIIGGFVGYLLAFSGGGTLTEELFVLGVIVVGCAALTGACIGVLCKLAYDRANGAGPPPNR